MNDDRAPVLPRPEIPAEISANSLSERLARGEALVVLDVRRPEERALCAIAVPTTAVDVFVPMDEIPARLAEVREARERGPVVVYCHHGVRSRMVADWLLGQGLSDVINLTGGVDAWSRGVAPGVKRY